MTVNVISYLQDPSVAAAITFFAAMVIILAGCLTFFIDKTILPYRYFAAASFCCAAGLMGQVYNSSHLLYIGFIATPLAILAFAANLAQTRGKQKYILDGAFALAVVLVGSMLVMQAPFWPAAILFSGFVLALSYGYTIKVAMRDIWYESKDILWLTVTFVLLGVGALLTIYVASPRLVGVLLIFAAFLAWTTLNIYRAYDVAIKRNDRLKRELKERDMELSSASGHKQRTQVKLMETGKISALASLSAGILHQISQPITAIHGFARFLRKEMPADGPYHKAVVLMDEQSIYLKEMLADLMELVRHRQIKKSDVDINVCLKRSLTLLTDELRIRRINWDLVPCEEPLIVYADGIHLQQIFMNLVINAMEALSDLPSGHERYIRIWSWKDADRNLALLAIQDTGPGITDDVKEQIFEPFFTTKTRGSGLGLALCQDLLAEHSGSIDARNNPEGGAKFVVTLPLAGVKSFI